MNLLIMFITIMFISILLMIISFWLPQTLPDVEKLSPYECGFDPLGSARLPFSIRFFLVAILFLLFDLEIALLLPTPWATNSPQPMMTILWTSTIIALLTAGLIYEWLQGGLDWAE
uniref:NADH-ubiquinone oxidoreductase chain 3 n=1 Tax=Darevskia clarkorum TaxID=122333 RepID=A0A7D0L673_9SAUR|nr:NADH dehydrogenase subunit 3 [Darevskia clarkorum]QDP70133.1 NADH dehydrogenase subunit 3 [Darevskia clarkorum]